jgi:hypothetical protein
MHLSKIRLLAAECETREGAIPAAIPGALRETHTFAISRDAFLLRLPNGLKFHYEKGKGVTVSRPLDMADPEVTLFLNGSVYGAIAWINGLVPLHASAVAHDGRVYAFTGHSGEGKSTLAAALGGKGLPLFADDVLVLDLSAPAEITCLPGHKQLKLWGDAIDLTGLVAGEQVRPGITKFYSDPKAGAAAEALPLGTLFFLESAARSEPRIEAISGIERFSLAREAFYRPQFCSVITENRVLFGIFSRLATQIAMKRFDRPRRKELFAAGVGLVAETIKSGG